ncbi:thiol-disulfide oxidoreductase DCC family protein [Salipaludibacillus daqingensis]|uniref:thiol-disulfide oxidoreductase DCC family protein n=1 Tax=Salipaludibacillus daqingensis TaxID=3041001 RepID=UPI002476CF0D|nr:thiol-disulfide oxidoreductase DCC family protein [Salipaludibacillus daqingensis]
MSDIILFDGVCNMCSASVQFIMKRDPNRRFMFVSLQSNVAEELLLKHNTSKDVDSVVLITEGGRVYDKSTAALRISSKLKGGWKLFAIFLIVPPFIRNTIYQWIAKHRYDWFGKKQECMLPTPEQKERFLD